MRHVWRARVTAELEQRRERETLGACMLGMARVQVVAECEHTPEQIGEHAALASGVGHLVACVRQLAQRRGARGYSRR